MSNALAGALWGMDYMLDMAARGCQGINFHGGGGSVISSALGDKLPGARDARDLEIARLGTFYSPIAGNPSEGYSRAAAVPRDEGRRTARRCESRRHGVRHAAARTPRPMQPRSKAGWRVALVNKDANRDLTVDIALPRDVPRDGHVWRLTGPSLDAIDGIALAAGQPVRSRRGHARSSNCRAPVPRSSASVEREGCMKTLSWHGCICSRWHSSLRSAAAAQKSPHARTCSSSPRASPTGSSSAWARRTA